MKNKLTGIIYSLSITFISSISLQTFALEGGENNQSNIEQNSPSGQFVRESAHKNRLLSQEELSNNVHEQRNIARENNPGYQNALENRNPNAETNAKRNIDVNNGNKSKAKRIHRASQIQKSRANNPGKRLGHSKGKRVQKGKR